MIVREARDGELEAVGELTARTYVADGFVAPESEYLDELRDAAARARHAVLLVAVEEQPAEQCRGWLGQQPGQHARDQPGERLLGTVTFCLGDTPYAETAGPGESAFRMLAVDPSARGRGVGEALVRACLNRARAAGASTMRLSTKKEMAAAHRLYERFGFRRTPELDWSPGPGLLLLTYALDL